MTDIQLPTASVEDKLLARNARHLARLMRVERDHKAVDDIAFFLHQTIMDVSANNPDSMCDMLVAHSRILDGAFGWFLDRAAGETSQEDFVSVAMALKAQQQTVRTLMTWKTIKDDDRVRQCVERHRAIERGLMEQKRKEEQRRYDAFDFKSLHDPEEKDDEQTEQGHQDAAMDA